MITHVAYPYVCAFYEVAMQKGVLSQVYEDVCLISELYKSIPCLDRFLKNPLVRLSEKQTLLEKVLGSYLVPQTLHFLHFIIQKKRYASLAYILKTFLRLYKRKHCMKIAHVTTSQALSSVLKDQISFLAANIAECSNVEIVEHIDSTILGGYIMQVEDKLLDVSLRTKLQQLHLFWSKR